MIGEDVPRLSNNRTGPPIRRSGRPLAGTRLAYGYRRARRWVTATVYARRHNSAMRHDAPTLNFYPSRPHPKAQIVRILRLLGTRIDFDPQADGVVMAWDGGTWFDPRAAARLPERAINGRCLDVSKTTVARVWAEVAGYALAVDPLSHDGAMVVKSELQGLHDGRLAEGPLARPEPGFVYERFVQSTQDGLVFVIRTPVIGGQIPVTMVKWRPAPQWFGGTAWQEARPTTDVFSAQEVDLLIRFAAVIGMDYGELDVLRDAHSGSIYVVDANRTPTRNPRLDPSQDEHIYPPMADAFRKLLEG